MSSSADWSSLPAELLQTIAGDLKIIADYIRFRSVCRFWRAAAELCPRFVLVPQEFPRLMLPLNQSFDRCCFFNPLTNRHHYGLPLPEPSAIHRCIGSYLGRLILVGSPYMVVLNPITGEKTYLPPLPSLPHLVGYRAMKNKYGQSLILDHYIKVVLTPRPNSRDPNNFSAFAISFNHLAYCKHGDHKWRHIDDNGTSGDYEDAIYFRGKLYLVNRQRSLATCDFNEHGTPSMYSITGDERIGVDRNRKYLLDVGGELVLVERYLEWERLWGFRTVTFCVLKFDWTAQEWKPVTSLGDSILFVGHNSSFAVTAASEYSGCKGNRIYFTGYYEIKDYDAGVYNLDDGTMETIDLYDGWTQSIFLSERRGSSPVWFTPSLW